MRASMCIKAILENADRNPKALAIITKSAAITYGELASRVERLAADLSKRGLPQGAPVAVCSSKSISWVVGMLAILSAGGVYIPVDPMLPMQRKRQMLEDSAVQLVLVEPPLRTMLPSCAPVLVLTDRVETYGDQKNSMEVGAEQCAYGIYTSGSTGIPKNVRISHRSLDAYAAALRDRLQLTSDDRYLHCASMSFSAAIRQLVAPLVSAATSVIVSLDDVRNVEMLLMEMIQWNVTVFDTVPSYLSRWLAAISDGPRDWRDRLQSKLRLVMTTGEPLPAGTARSFRSLFPAAQMWNLYGQTETTGTIAIYEIGDVIPDPIPIGQPLGENRLYVLDDDLNATTEGELYVAGPCLAREYFGHPQLTASRFVANPFDSEPGSRIYGTGDRVRRGEGGNLEFRGRKDDQVKVNEIRINLGEIDALLKADDDLLEAATVLRSIGGESLRLVSFVVARTGRPRPAEERLREHLAQYMAESTIPSLLVFVSELPKTSSGKVDRQELLRCDIDVGERRMPSEPPRTDIEQLVGRCWEEVLNVSAVGRKDDFFALGGDSLQAINMVLRIQSELSIQLPLASYFFQDPTLEAFAATIEWEIGGHGRTAAAGIRADER